MSSEKVDDIQPTSVPRRLRLLMLPSFTSVMLRCVDIDDDDNDDEGEEELTFWWRMRDELLRDLDQERYRRQFHVMSIVVERQ